MATYIFENMSPSDAAAFGDGDTLVFSSSGASATTVSVSPYAQSGTSGSLQGTGINLSYNGETLTFSNSLSVASNAGHVLFPDSSHLLIGSNSAADTIGSASATSQQVIYGLGGNDIITVATAATATDFVYGGVGDDTIGSSTSNGNYHIYGNAAGSPAPLATGQTDVDTITTGYGSSYIQGNAGNDVISVGSGTVPTTATPGNNTVFGGADNDQITVLGAGFNHVNGNKGADTIIATSATGNNVLLGGAGNDTIYAGHGQDVIQGQAGSDDLYAGTGTGHITVMTGGSTTTLASGNSDGADNFHFTTATGAAAAQGTGTALSSSSTELYFNEITDFTAGTDHIVLGFSVNGGSGTPTTGTPGTFGILVQDPGVTFTTESAAQTYAQSLLNTANHTGDVAAIQVGSDTFLFYDSTQSATSHTIDSVIKLDGVTATALTQSTTTSGAHDFTAATITH